MLLTATTTMLRASAGRSASALQPTFLRSAACPYSAGLTLSPFSTATTTPSKSARSLATRPSTQSSTTLLLTYRAATAAEQHQRQQLIPRRYASTHQHPPVAAAETSPDAAADAKAAEAAARAARAAHPGQVAMDWNTFFALRKARRRWQSAFSVVMALASGTGGAVVIGSGYPMVDWVMGKIPLDPLFTMGLATLGFAALGWLVGPSIGTLIFNMIKSKYKGPMAVKESEFFARIKKHRVDPSASSVRNPGELRIHPKGLVGMS